MRKIIAVSAGEDVTKKGNSAFRRKIKYLNYGLLGLVTLLKKTLDFDVVMFQADHDLPRELIEKIFNIYDDCEYILLSIPSYYSMTWCQSFCKIIKTEYGNKKIIIGGRWVVDNNKEWIIEKLKYFDAIIDGFGEKKLIQFFDSKIGSTVIDGSKKCFDTFDYTLLHNYINYQPCIEVSRGCGSGCHFCLDKDNKRLLNKNVQTILAEWSYLESIYKDFTVYLEAPHLIFEKNWTKDLCEGLIRIKNNHLWRCTSRVESIPLDYLEDLSKAGLKVLDIGLESASIQQLLNMKKTNNPYDYLEYAEKILKECKKHDIWVKFNLLLYAGENRDTISETISWLNRNKELIKDVSVSSLVYYKNMKDIRDILSLGATIPEGMSVDDLGFINLNLSSEIDYIEAKKMMISIPKIVANQKDFYDIKSISYFENNYTYQQFLNDLKQCRENELPFRVEN